jgi:hypothetical protein
MLMSKTFSIVGTVVAALFSSTVLHAQLIDPNKRCYYRAGSTVCEPMPTAPGQPPPPAVSVNQCEAGCNATQQACMKDCTARNDWYRCFAYCGGVRTNCLRGCPLR